MSLPDVRQTDCVAFIARFVADSVAFDPETITNKRDRVLFEVGLVTLAKRVVDAIAKSLKNGQEKSGRVRAWSSRQFTE